MKHAPANQKAFFAMIFYHKMSLTLRYCNCVTVSVKK